MSKEVSLESKLLAIRLELLGDLGKSGENKFSHYDYFQLKDFIPQIIRLCDKHGVYTKFWMDYEKIALPGKVTTQITEDGKEITIREENFDYKEFAYLKAINLENPEEEELYKKETASVRIQGAQDIQNHGGKSTYMKRYMYMDMFEIVENDFVEENTGAPTKVETKTAPKATSKPVTKPVATKVEPTTPNETVTTEAPTTSVVQNTEGELMTMDHKVELSNYMKEKGLDPRTTIVDAAKHVGVDVPYLKEEHFEVIKKFVDEKVGN